MVPNIYEEKEATDFHLNPLIAFLRKNCNVKDSEKYI